MPSNRLNKAINITIIVLLTICISYPVKQTFAQENLSISDCLKIAEQNSWEIKKAVADIEKADWSVKESITSFLPVLSTEYSYAYLSPQSTITIGNATIPTGSQNNYSWKIQLAQPVYTGGKLTTARKLSEAGLDVSKIILDKIRLELALSVKQAYFDVLLAQKAKLVAEDLVNALESQANVSRNFYEVGLIPKNDMLRVEVDLADAKQSLTLAKNGVSLAKAALNTILRQNVNKDIALDDVFEIEQVTPGFDESINTANKNRPEVKAAEKTIDIAEKKIRLAESDYYPNVNLVTSYERNNDNLWVWNKGDYTQKAESTTVAMSMTWDFWEWGKTRYKVAQEKAEKLKAGYSLKQLKDQIALQVKQALLNLTATRSNIGVARLGISQAEENYRISQERYKEQVTTSTEVLDAQTRLTTAQRNYYAALYDYHKASAQLKFATGVID